MSKREQECCVLSSVSRGLRDRGVQETDVGGTRGRKRLELAAVRDGDLGAGFAAVAAVALHHLDDVHTLHDLTEHHMLPIQPAGNTIGAAR